MQDSKICCGKLLCTNVSVQEDPGLKLNVCQLYTPDIDNPNFEEPNSSRSQHDIPFNVFNSQWQSVMTIVLGLRALG